MEHTPHETILFGPVLPNTRLSTGASAVNSPLVVANPGKWGRYMVFLLSLQNSLTVPAVTAFNADVQGSLDGSTNWTALTFNDGSTHVSFTQAAPYGIVGGGTADGAAAGGIPFVFGTVPLYRVHYPYLRLGNITFTGGASSTLDISCTYIVAPTREQAVKVQYPFISGTPLNAYGNDVAGGGQVDPWLSNMLGVGLTL